MMEAFVDPNAPDSDSDGEPKSVKEPAVKPRQTRRRAHEHSAITIKLSNKTLGRSSSPSRSRRSDSRASIHSMTDIENGWKFAG